MKTLARLGMLIVILGAIVYPVHLDGVPNLFVGGVPNLFPGGLPNLFPAGTPRPSSDTALGPTSSPTGGATNPTQAPTAGSSRWR